MLEEEYGSTPCGTGSVAGAVSSGALWEECLAKEQESALALPLQPGLLLKILSQWALKGRDFHARSQPSWLPHSGQAHFLDRCAGNWAHTQLCHGEQRQGLGHLCWTVIQNSTASKQGFPCKLCPKAMVFLRAIDELGSTFINLIPPEPYKNGLSRTSLILLSHDSWELGHPTISLSSARL